MAVRGCPYLDKLLFCHSPFSTLSPAPHLPLAVTHSIAWSVRPSVTYINPNTLPKELQLSSLGYCCTRSARHGTLFPFLVLTVNLRLRADGRCRAVQARLCHKCCGHVIGLRPYPLSMTSSPFALVAVPGFSSFHFRFVPSDKRTFAIRHW